jgi:hypothetical protein
MVAVTVVVALSAAHAGDLARGGQFPIVDAHAHIGGSFKWGAIVGAMDKNGVSKQIVMARAYPGMGDSDLPGDDQTALRLAETYPGRVYRSSGCNARCSPALITGQP